MAEAGLIVKAERGSQLLKIPNETALGLCRVRQYIEEIDDEVVHLSNLVEEAHSALTIRSRASENRSGADRPHTNGNGTDPAVHSASRSQQDEAHTHDTRGASAGSGQH